MNTQTIIKEIIKKRVSEYRFLYKTHFGLYPNRKEIKNYALELKGGNS